jgi:hypothetical protein
MSDGVTWFPETHRIVNFVSRSVLTVTHWSQRFLRPIAAAIARLSWRTSIGKCSSDGGRTFKRRAWADLHLSVVLDFPKCLACFRYIQTQSPSISGAETYFFDTMLREGRDSSVGIANGHGFNVWHPEVFNTYTVILRLRKIIRSGITFVSRNLR